MSFVVQVRRAAELDMAQAQGWYEQQQAGLGAAFLSEVAAVISRLAETPLIYAAVHREVRRAVLRRFPYLLWYRVTGNTVRILACTQGSQNPATVLARFQ